MEILLHPAGKLSPFLIALKCDVDGQMFEVAPPQPHDSSPNGVTTAFDNRLCHTGHGLESGRHLIPARNLFHVIPL